MKAFLEEYGLIIVVVAVIMVMLLMMTTVGGQVKGNIIDSVANLFGLTEQLDVDLVPEQPLVGEAYAIYDSNVQTLYFLRSETPIEEGTTLEISGDRTINTSKVYSGIENFEAENYTKVLWYNNNRNITTVEFLDEIRPVYTNSWFMDFNRLTNIIGIEKLNTSNTVNMCGMFNGTRRLEQLDVSHFDTSKVTNMASMFGYASAESLDLSNFDTSNVVNMCGMFNGYTSLKTLNLDGWVTSQVTDMSYMFTNCSSLETLDISHFNTAKVKNMSAMFSNCTKLELDCSEWNVENVINYVNFNTSAPKVIAPAKFSN